MKYLIPFLIIIFFISCIKETPREYFVSGQITDKYSNKSFNLNIPICATNRFFGAEPVAETKTDISGYYQLNFDGERNLSRYHIYADNFYPLTFKDGYPYGLSIYINEGSNIVNIQGMCRVDVVILFERDSTDIVDSVYLKTITPVNTYEEYVNIYDYYEYYKEVQLYATNENYIIVNYNKNGIQCMTTDTIVPNCSYDAQMDTIKF